MCSDLVNRLLQSNNLILTAFKDTRSSLWRSSCWVYYITKILSTWPDTAPMVTKGSWFMSSCQWEAWRIIFLVIKFLSQVIYRFDFTALFIQVLLVKLFFFHLLQRCWIMSHDPTSVEDFFIRILVLLWLYYMTLAFAFTRCRMWNWDYLYYIFRIALIGYCSGRCWTSSCPICVLVLVFCYERWIIFI